MAKKNNLHYFDKSEAQAIGIVPAIVLFHFSTRAAAATPGADGIVWIETSLDELEKNLPYLSKFQIQRALVKLVEAGKIIKKRTQYKLFLRIAKLQFSNGSELQNCNAELQNCNSANINKELRRIEKRKNSAHARVININNKSASAGPSMKEVESYVRECGYSYNYMDFFTYYSAQGWHIGISPITDWRALADWWERNSKAKNRQKINESEKIACSAMEGMTDIFGEKKK